MIYITALPALKDNYIWVIIHLVSGNCLIVDPGESKVVINYLTLSQWRPRAILLTHHHADHTSGAQDLSVHYQIPVFGPGIENIAAVTQPLEGQESLHLQELGLNIQVLAIPGHTRGHLAYYSEGLLFCGDTLFTGACGRLFEGSAEQMYNSLTQLSALPDHTLVYCGHEYTQDNLVFAQTIEPNNPALQLRIKQTNDLRSRGLATVPSSLKVEKQTNPFLRCHEPAIMQHIATFSGKYPDSPAEAFAALRSQKDSFKIR